MTTELIATETEILTTEQQHTLEQMEGVIRDYQRAFLKTCVALTVIESGDLYRPFKSLTAYCRAKFEMDDAATTRHKQAGELLLALSGKTAEELLSGSVTKMKLPANEGQCRELTQLDPETQRSAWTKVLESSKKDDFKITAKAIRKVVKEMTAPESEEMPSAERKTEESPTDSEPVVECQAALTLTFETEASATVAEDALGYSGEQLVRDGNDLTWTIVGESKETIIEKLAHWSQLGSVSRAVIDFS